jgi:acyl-CoA thioesterase FadM
MLNDETNEIAAATSITGVLLDAATRKPTPFPPEALERARVLMVEVMVMV